MFHSTSKVSRPPFGLQWGVSQKFIVILVNAHKYEEKEEEKQYVYLTVQTWLHLNTTEKEDEQITLIVNHLCGSL